MARNYGIIARYTDGRPQYYLGKKADPDMPLNEENVIWMKKDGRPVIFEEYSDAKDYLENRRNLAG